MMFGLKSHGFHSLYGDYTAGHTNCLGLKLQGKGQPVFRLAGLF